MTNDEKNERHVSGQAASESIAGVEDSRPSGPGMYLHWDGRKTYRARMPAPRILETDEELSFGHPRLNRIIEGDNLQAMVSLRSQYRDSVDVAYLDPPYNTGKKDFRYSDRRYHDPNASADDAVYVNNDDGGKHTKWLNYIGPRLYLTWELLADHGVCFVSINDVELFRLGLLMDEIFGEKNRIGVMVWKQAVDNNKTRIAVEHEYVLCYAKRIEETSEHWQGTSVAKQWLLNKYDELRKTYTDVEELQRRWREAIREQKKVHRTAVAEGRGDDEVDVGRMDRFRNINEHGPWAKDWHLENTKEGGYDYDIPHPKTGLACRKPPKGYRYPEESMARLLSEDRIVFGKDHTETAQLRRYLRDSSDALRSVVTIPGRNGSDRLAALLPEEAKKFPHPKPVELLELLLGAAGDIDALVLDPFAGSGSTGEAVMKLNARDNGIRRFILIEEGEPGDRYARTLTGPRLRAAIEKEGWNEGFEFLTTGRKLDRDAILTLEREAITSLVLQTDPTGMGGGMRKINGKFVVAANGRSQAICLNWNGRADSVITREVLVEMFNEAKDLNLKKPLRVYGSTCEVGETDSFVFRQIPDAILAALQLVEEAQEEPDIFGAINDLEESIRAEAGTRG